MRLWTRDKRKGLGEETLKKEEGITNKHAKTSLIRFYGQASGRRRVWAIGHVGPGTKQLNFSTEEEIKITTLPYIQ